jgi:hypothetical protein
VKIAGMVLWVLTAGIGGYLLAVGFAAQRARQEAEQEAAAGRAAEAAGTAGAAGAAGRAAGAPGAAGAARAQMARQMQVAGEMLPQDEAVVMGSAAVLGGVVPEAGGVAGAGLRPVAGGGRAEIEGSPLLEFVHPALALTGLTLWIFYTVSGDRLFAWVGFGIVVATVLAGVGWVLMTKGVERRRAARAEAPGGAGSESVGFPDHLVLLHGAAALCTIALVAVCLFAVVHL